MGKIKLLIADDHRIIINGIKMMLEDEPDVEIVGDAADGREAVRTALSIPDLDVVLMDIKMPEMNGIEATRELTRQHPKAKVLALTMFDSDEYITGMLNAGAKGYILKNTGIQELVTAIKKVAGGENFFSEAVTNAIIAKFVVKASTSQPAEFSPPKELTDREIEILRHIASEKSNHEISEIMLISPRTVHSHRRNLMQKLGVKNTVGLVRYAIQHGYITPPKSSS
jgi:DNA-binding NarL/FixJ family response regulator